MSQEVPYSGPDKYDLLVVGEAPGELEEKQGVPFVGPSGKLLKRYLARAGMNPNLIRFANLCKYRPTKNQFKRVLGTEALKAGLNDLEKEIAHASPKCILALGGYPLYFLTGEHTGKTPGSGITKYRGSILPALARFGGTKVVSTFHPAYILRGNNWKWNPVFYIDIQKAAKEAQFPELNPPTDFYKEFVDPDEGELERLLNAALTADWLSVDIETFPGGRYSCVGFYWGTEDSLCITYERPDYEPHVRTLWESSVRKIFQYGTYDISFMRKFYGMHIGGYYNGQGWDTYVATANLLPDFPRSLGFLASIYTRFPYYKEERKLWKEAPDMSTLWSYNIKDVVATYQVALAQMSDMEGHYA